MQPGNQTFEVGLKEAFECYNPCINLPADNLSWSGFVNAAESNFRLRCYQTPTAELEATLSDVTRCSAGQETSNGTD